ncbi:Guanylate cyclase [Gryllus bimaculatus]|nr:Guanylate cyclase [Gryllus bimaculatus]
MGTCLHGWLHVGCPGDDAPQVGMNQDNLKPWLNESDTDERNARARKAYEALLTVTASTPNNTQYSNFSEEVKSLARDKFNYTSNSSVSTFVTAFYDAVVLYALALNETLSEGGSERDGATITRHMWNRTFVGTFAAGSVRDGV